ncbi:MAG: hypothetical protein M1828_003518 [Chrysothrix sp. TS-e1954]|nr:MAG: hypothetical protein M1828_003518 [Chrysothrix sp. TS-e1954]
MSSSLELSSDQLHALFDILSHNEVNAEIEDFRIPGALTTYGPPFEIPPNSSSTSPSLQTLVSRFILTLPGLKNVAAHFWQRDCASLIDDLARSELSESYDKGHIGIRKTLATAISSLIEYPARGVLGGFDPPSSEAPGKQYDLDKADDLQQAFKDVLQQGVYGDMIGNMFARAAQTDKLSEHPQIVQAAHQYIVVNLASFMHYTLIMSPKGQGLLTLIDHANKLIPYTIIRQTLKIGNVASMLNAMMKVVLAKMSVASVTNWMGLTQSSDEGMNLMQEIISTVLYWDIRDLKSRATKIEKSKDSPSKEQLTVLKQYTTKSRQDHEKLRKASSTQRQSIVTAILSASLAAPSLTESQHSQAQDYLAIVLSIRDREQIVKVLCHSSPDHLTQAVRDAVSAYEPMIRQVHQAVDLSDTVTDFEVFLRDMIKLAKLPEPRSGRQADAQPVPTVGDFVQLLTKHQSSSHKFMHQTCKNGKEVTSWFRDYATHAANQFRQQSKESANTGAGDLAQPLQSLFSTLEESKQRTLLPILDKYAIYIDKLHAASAVRLRAVVSSPTSNHPALNPATNRSSSRFSSRASSPAPSAPVSRSNSKTKKTSNVPHAAKQDSGTPDPGPGAFLARWQSLLDGTAITPSGADGGKVRGGGAIGVLKASAAEPDQGLAESEKAATQQQQQPDVASDEKEDTTTSPRPATSNDNTNENDENEDDDATFHDAQTGIDELGLADHEKVPRPDTRPVVESLMPAFRKMLGQRNCVW